jgi:hypothetical protein
MIWLVWRQHRKQALYGFAVLALLALIMIPSGIAVHRSFVDSGFAAWVRASTVGSPIASRR